MLFLMKSINAQHNFLGKTQGNIQRFYRNKSDFSVRVDTLRNDRILLTARNTTDYPYYSYEIDAIEDKCVSYGFVSKNRDILKTYIEVLDFSGSLISADSSFVNFIYMIDLTDKKIYYSIKQPFANSNIISRRNLFYILVTQEEKEKKED